MSTTSSCSSHPSLPPPLGDADADQQPQPHPPPLHPPRPSRPLPHRLTTSFFSRSRKGSDSRSPTSLNVHSPASLKSPARAMTDLSPSATGSPRGSERSGNSRGGLEVIRTGTEPIAIPASASQHHLGSAKQKKLAPSSSFNSHYRTISRSMNDLGNIFSRGRSPPNRDVSPRRGTPLNTLPEGYRSGVPEPPNHTSSGTAHPRFESGSVPVISIMQHGGQQAQPGPDHHHERRHDAAKEGWVNMADSQTVKKMPSMKEAFKLQHAVITNGCLMLYKPPSGIQIKAFDPTAASTNVQRPQTAPATASPNFNVSSLRHKSTARHPELVTGEDGRVLEGTVEALCHELMFTEDATFIQPAAQTLSGWTGPETALSVLVELSALQDRSSRIGEILTIVVESTPGLLLEPGSYNTARLLVEKGVAPHNQELAKNLRLRIQENTMRLQASLGLPKETEDDAPENPRPMALTADEFLEIEPEVLAQQIHLFHLKYFQAWSPVNDISLLLASPHLPPPSQRNPLVFSASSIHFLGERVFNHVLYGDSVTSLDKRADVLTRWIHISHLLKSRGDMVGYLAIVVAILSPPILRLRETWSVLDPPLVEELKEAGNKAMRILERRKLSGESDNQDGRAFIPRGVGSSIPTSQAVPYFGDLCHCMDEAYANRGRNLDFSKSVLGMQNMRQALDKWKKEWVWEQNPPTVMQVDEIGDFQRCLHALNAANQNPQAVNSPMFFERSLVCEPSISGMYLHSHYHQKLPLSTGANIPLVFTDVLPSYAIFDRYHALAISGHLHKKTPSSGLGSPGLTPGVYQPASQNLRPPTAQTPVPNNLRRTHSFPPSKPDAQTTGYFELDVMTRQKTEGLVGQDDAMVRAIRDVAGVGQRLFYSKDGELVLKAITEEDARSRPNSVIENTSNRQSISSRRQSQIHSNGASPRVSTHGDQAATAATTPVTTPIREEFSDAMLVVPKGGTLERLVDILVLGVEDFSKRMNSSEEGNPLLQMNMDVFTVTFFATFRSYCSPVVLIEYLKKRLLGSKSAATSKTESDDVVFPDWTGVDHVNDHMVDWELVGKIHLGILDAIDVWLSEFFVDFHSDQYLSESFISFLEVAAKEVGHWNNLDANHQHLRKYAQQINQLWLEVREKFSKLVFTPAVYDLVPEDYPEPPKISMPMPSELLHLEEFIESLEVKVRDHFATVKLVDWMLAFELLEMQSSEPLGFFVPKPSLLWHEDEEHIQNIFFLLPKLLRANTNTTLLEALPKCLREVCQLHMQISQWVLTQIVDSRINVEARARRIETLLRCLAISRKRMERMDLHENVEGVQSSRHVPSFVSTAIAAALVRPESRLFSYAWYLAAKATVGSVSQIQTLEQVIPRDVEGLRCMRPMTPCVGWMLERLLEIVCYVPNMVVENNRLINFDKRRYVFNFINNLTNEVDESPKDDIATKSFSLASPANFDARALRDQANRENQLSKHGRIKVFWALLHAEQEKNRRDAKQRDAIERQQRNQMRAEHRRQPTTSRADASDKKSGKRLGVNSIFKAVRPISMAFTSGWTPPASSPRFVPPADLPSLTGVEHGRKANVIIDLRSVASVSCPHATRDKCIWKITPSTGATYLFQATSERDLDQWLKCIATIRGVNATDGSESVDAMTLLSQNRQPQPMFGVSLEELCLRDHVKVPVVVEAMLSEIEQRGLSEVGIYRVPGSLSSINALKLALDSGEDVAMDDDRWYDINVIAGVFKLFMRELPDQAIPAAYLQELRDLTEKVTDETDRIPAYREVVLRLPACNYHFLRRVYIHFARIAKNASVNKMHAVNLAIVFGMGLAPNQANPMGISPDLGLYQTMVRTWINNADEIFPEVEDDQSSSALATTAASIMRTETASVDAPSSEPSTPALEQAASHSSPAMSIDETSSYTTTEHSTQ